MSRHQLRLSEDGLMDLETWMIDSTAVRATRASAGGGKKEVLKNPSTMYWVGVEAASQTITSYL